MNTRIHSGRLFPLLLTMALSLPSAAFAEHGGQGQASHGSFHAAGGSRATPSAHASYHNSPAAYQGSHSAATRGYYVHGSGRSYYGGRPYYRSGYYGRRYYGGYYGRGYRGPYWYGALAIGAFVATLPLYYDTYWWGGVPYYYYDNTYYRWDSDARGYEVVAPPEGEEAGSSQSSANNDLYVYPKDGQSAEQQKTDRYECHRWAADQTGFDPTQSVANKGTSNKADYVRAQTACLTARGYSVQ